MIGYAPFLGQVRMASASRRAIGQGFRPVAVLDIEKDRERDYACTKSFGFDMGFAETVWKKVTESTPLTAGESDYLNSLHACLAPGYSAPAPSYAPASSGVPMWAWVAGSAAVAGLVAYIATR